jgi:hypothetical protein
LTSYGTSEGVHHKYGDIHDRIISSAVAGIHHHRHISQIEKRRKNKRASTTRTYDIATCRDLQLHEAYVLDGTGSSAPEEINQERQRNHGEMGKKKLAKTAVVAY